MVKKYPFLSGMEGSGLNADRSIKMAETDDLYLATWVTRGGGVLVILIDRDNCAIHCIIYHNIPK